MADISSNATRSDIQISGGDLVFTSDIGFRVTMQQRVRAYLKTFLGEWFLDDEDDPVVGVPYFQSLFVDKLPTLETADTVFRTALFQIEDVVAVDELSFDYNNSTRQLDVTFKIRITGDGNVIEDVVPIGDIISEETEVGALTASDGGTDGTRFSGI